MTQFWNVPLSEAVRSCISELEQLEVQYRNRYVESESLYNQYLASRNQDIWFTCGQTQLIEAELFKTAEMAGRIKDSEIADNYFRHNKKFECQLPGMRTLPTQGMKAKKIVDPIFKDHIPLQLRPRKDEDLDIYTRRIIEQPTTSSKENELKSEIIEFANETTLEVIKKKNDPRWQFSSKNEGNKILKQYHFTSYDRFEVQHGKNPPENFEGTFVLQLYTARELRMLLQTCGFETIQQCGLDGSRFTPSTTENIPTVAQSRKSSSY